MKMTFESNREDDTPFAGSPPQDMEEGTAMLTEAEMRGMYYRNEIDREVLWQLERMHSNALGALLPMSALARAQEIAKVEGRRFWTWNEERTLSAADLLALAEQRKAKYQAHLSHNTVQSIKNAQKAP